MKHAWQEHEAHVNALLGLDATVHSGNRWHDQGDGVDRSHPSQNSFALIADCKCTGSKSISIKSAFLKDWCTKAAEMGKRFIMPIRFDSPIGIDAPQDYVLLSLDDFVELLEKSKPKVLDHPDRTWMDYDEYRRYANG
jgi:hypothetical protein